MSVTATSVESRRKQSRRKQSRRRQSPRKQSPTSAQSAPVHTKKPEPGWDPSRRTLFVRSGDSLTATTGGDVDATVVILNGRPIEELKLDLLHRPFPSVDLAASLRPAPSENFLTVQVWNRNGSVFNSRVEVASGDEAVAKVFHRTGCSSEVGLASSETVRIVVLETRTAPVREIASGGRVREAPDRTATEVPDRTATEVIEGVAWRPFRESA